MVGGFHSIQEMQAIPRKLRRTIRWRRNYGETWLPRITAWNGKVVQGCSGWLIHKSIAMVWPGARISYLVSVLGHTKWHSLFWKCVRGRGFIMLQDDRKISFIRHQRSRQYVFPCIIRTIRKCARDNSPEIEMYCIFSILNSMTPWRRATRALNYSTCGRHRNEEFVNHTTKIGGEFYE